MPSNRTFHTINEALVFIYAELGTNIRIGMPLGLGKPNVFINALYDDIKAHENYHLEIYTALSLLKPTAGSELEQRFLAPLLERLYGNYPDLHYALDMHSGNLPANVTVHEFFLKSGDWLHNEHAQQNYICANYTHIARDMSAKNINVLAQEVAAKIIDGKLRLSLSCNPDVSFDIVESLRSKNPLENSFQLIAVINHQLPFMPGTAEVDADFFDIIIDDPAASHDLFCTPNMKVALTDYAIGLHASSLVQDGGTLQIGIGSLGDAIAQSLIVRNQHNDAYKKMLALTQHSTISPLVHSDIFSVGLYGCSEMFVNGLLQLIEADIIKREVLDSNGKPVIFHGGFFIGPRSFYQTLRDMPQEKLAKIDMQRITFINQLYGNETLKREQRKKAAFINTCMMVTLSGAAVSDGLDDGQVVSGVGGQYNFVAMAHELEDARSILMLRSFRVVDGEAQSNIVSQYGHCTIPRHLRDIVITEYGIADLRGKTDSEVIEALLSIADSRFQQDLQAWAIEKGKLPPDYRLPEQFRANTPESIDQKLQAFKHYLPEYPFGHDFTEDELVIVHALQKLKATIANPLDNAAALVKSLLHEHEIPERYLQRMGFSEEDSFKTRLLRKLFAGNL